MPLLLNTHLLRLPHSPPPPRTSNLPLPCSCSHHLPMPSSRRAHPPLRHVAAPPPDQGEEDDDLDLGGPPSAAAVAAAIRRASTASPVRFTCLQREEARGEAEPSADFRRLCGEQLEMFRLVVSRDAALSLYVRPAGSYTMDHQLELRRVALHPDRTDVQTVMMLAANFSVPSGLRAAESLLVKHQMHVVPEFGSVVLPMVKHPFVVGFLVAELPGLAAGHATINSSAAAAAADIQRSSDVTPLYDEDKALVFPASGDQVGDCSRLVAEWKKSALLISRTLATAYVMDQKAYLLQQTSWQNNVRMSGLVEQIRGPLSNIRALAKMLTAHSKSSEIPYDIVQDILIQGDHLKDALEQIQDAVYLTKANIVRYNEETLKKIQGSPHSSTTLSGFGSEHGDSSQRVGPMLSLNSDKDDMVMPMPPLWLAPLQHQDSKPCDLCDVLKDLVDAASPLAYKQNGTLDVTGVSHPLQVAVEESALRQALSNLIEGALLRTRFGGRVQIYAGEAPAGGTLVVIDDDGPDMEYMTQMHSLAPFGSDLLTEGMLEDNMTWNFIAGLTVAREILENYGCILRVISPRIPDAVIGTGGSRIEVWLPTFQTELADITEEA